MPKIIHSPKKCVNCGNCVSICSDLFKINNNKVLLIGGKLNENSGNFEKQEENIACAEDAVNVCPVEAIIIEKTKN